MEILSSETIFYKNNKLYKIEINYLDEDNYSIRLFNGMIELFSTWIDSCGGEVNGNAEIYTNENIDDVIQECYDLFNIFSNSILLIRG